MVRSLDTILTSKYDLWVVLTKKLVAISVSISSELMAGQMLPQICGKR